MIDITKTNGCDECMSDKVILHVLTVGKKKITLCEKCMRELLRVTEEYVDKLGKDRRCDNRAIEIVKEELDAGLNNSISTLSGRQTR